MATLRRPPTTPADRTVPDAPIVSPAGFRPITLGKAILGYVSKRKRASSRHTRRSIFPLLRLYSIERLRTFRIQNGVVPVEDEAYWLAALPSILDLVRQVGGNPAVSEQPIIWAMRFAPAVIQLRGEEWMAATQMNYATTPRRVTADELARQLMVTNDERVSLNLRTFGAIDRLKEQRIQDRRNRDKARKKMARAAAGAIPRELSKTATKPWERAGMSRTKWYEEERRRKNQCALRTDSSAANLKGSLLTRTNLSQAKTEASEGPARPDSETRSDGAGVPSAHWLPAIVLLQPWLTAHEVRRGSSDS